MIGMINVHYNPIDNLYSLTSDNSDLDFALSESEARNLVRQFIESGLSMSFPDQSYSAGELKATKEHLNDLRRVLFEDKQ